MDAMILPEACSNLLGGRLATAVELAKLAGQSTLELFGSSRLAVERKGDDSPVTVADKRAEQLIRAELAKRFPDDSILGEEFGASSGDSDFGWIVDPIDGTKSFISGVPLYSTLVAVIRDQQAVAGVIYIPALDEIVFAAKEGGCWHSRGGSPAVRAQVSSRALDQGLLVITQLDSFATHGAESAYKTLEREAYITRSWGDGYGYLLVATGRAELMIDPIANPWDLAAVQVVVDEAGGQFTDWHGQSTYSGGQGVASNGVVHPYALQQLGPVARTNPPGR
jgi:histidinol-phosphatase